MTYCIATLLGLALLAAGCGRGESPASEAPADAASRPSATAQTLGDEAQTVGGETADAPRAADAASPASLYTVQVAAFLSADSARIWSDRLGRAGLPVWTTTAEVAGRTFHRLRVGAHPEVAGARRLGERIRRELQWPVWIAPVERQAALPEDVVTRTRALVDAP